ncbi:MAG: LysR family transcriptional regulator [Faecalibacillus sp.]
MIEINQLEQLVCIAENGTISKASKELLISQPALSRSMQRLEFDLNVQLFDHYKNKVVLNKNGELAVEHAKKILNDLSKMVDDVQAFDKSFQTLSIASCTPAPIWDIEPIIQELYTHIHIQTDIVDQKELINVLKKQQYHMVITPFEVKDPNLICIPYIEEDLYLSLPLNHPLKDKNEVSFKDLDGETMLLYSNIGFWYDMHMKTTPNTKFLIQDERLTFNEIVKASLLPSFTSNLSIKREGKMSNRVIIPFSDEEAHVTYYLIILKKDKNKYIDLIHKIENYYDF